MQHHPFPSLLVHVHLSIRMPYLRNQHLVTGLHTRRNPLPFLIQRTRTNSQNLCLVQFFDSALREEETAGCLGLGFYALHEDAVKEGSDGAD